MYKLWMQARANIRKTKSVSVTLFIMFLIAGLLLNAGLLVSINYGGFFGSLKEELAPSDVYYAIPDMIYKEEAMDYLAANEHVEKTQKNKALWVTGEHKDGAAAGTLPVYVPSVFQAVGGYDPGDQITIKYAVEHGVEETLTFTVQGFIEDIFFSSTDTGMLGFYLPEDAYEQLGETLSDPSYALSLVFTDLDDVKSAADIESGIREILALNSASLIAGDAASMLVSIDIDLIEMARCMMATMVAAMMVVFALIVVAVCLLVVRFRIVNSIEDDMMKIGSLKAIGYTCGQLRLSLLMQYLLIAGLGTIAGIALTYPALPAISSVFEQQSGLKWVQGFDGAISSVALAVIILIILAVVLLATRKVKHLSPISALRGESTVRKFKHNRMPLDKAAGPLPAVLGMKSILQNIKQNIMIAVILVAVTFAGSYGVVMYYNTSVDTTAFAEVPGMEITNVVATLNPELDQTEAVKAVEGMQGVRKTVYLDQVKLRVEDTEVTAFVMDDFSEKETNLVYDGRYPENEQELLLAGILADRLEKKVGDDIRVNFGDKTETFRVTGLTNGSSMGGLNTSILTGDYKRLNPDFKKQTLNIYLEEGVSSAAFIKTLEKTLDEDILLASTDFDKLLAEGMASYQYVVAAMGLAMLVITILVVTLVLYFMISSSIIRQKRELGIQKAIGFTTFQLMNQLSLTFTLPVAVGAIIGSLLGAFCTNPMMSFAMRSVGIMKANFIVDPLWVVFFGAGTILFSYLLSLLTTWRIRKISAYSLVTE